MQIIQQKANRFIFAASRYYSESGMEDKFSYPLSRRFTFDMNYLHNRSIEVERLEASSGEKVYSYKFNLMNWQNIFSLKIIPLSPFSRLKVIMHYDINNNITLQDSSSELRSELERIMQDTKITDASDNDVVASLMAVSQKNTYLPNQIFSFYEYCFSDVLNK